MARVFLHFVELQDHIILCKKQRNIIDPNTYYLIQQIMAQDNIIVEHGMASKAREIDRPHRVADESRPKQGENSHHTGPGQRRR